MDGWTDGWKDERLDGGTNCPIDRMANGQMNSWNDGRMDRQRQRQRQRQTEAETEAEVEAEDTIKFGKIISWTLLVLYLLIYYLQQLHQLLLFYELWVFKSGAILAQKMCLFGC